MFEGYYIQVWFGSITQKNVLRQFMEFHISTYYVRLSMNCYVKAQTFTQSAILTLARSLYLT